MQIAIIKDGAIEAIGNYRALFPNVSFPVMGPDAEFMEQNSAVRVSEFRPHDSSTQKLVPCGPVLEDGVVYTVEVTERTEEEVAVDLEALAVSIRNQRNQLLAACDWTQCKDIPDSISSVWATYRQALRDITAQETFPTSVVWPTQPE